MKGAGFTLTEVVITLIVLAILVAVVFPRVIMPVSSAKQAETDSVARSLNMVSQQNYLIYRVYAFRSTPVANCQDVSALLPPGDTMPDGYAIMTYAVSDGAKATCTLVNPDGATTATFIGIGVSY